MFFVFVVLQGLAVRWVQMGLTLLSLSINVFEFEFEFSALYCWIVSQFCVFQASKDEPVSVC